VNAIWQKSKPYHQLPKHDDYNNGLGDPLKTLGIITVGKIPEETSKFERV